MTAREVIERLGLVPHPEEGGWFRETWRSGGGFDEVFHFYLGDPVEMLELLPDGRGRVTVLGAGLDGMRPQHVVPGGVWQGSRLRAGGAWALLGTTMSPGFAYEDYEHGGPELVTRYPEHGDLVRALLPGGAPP